MRPADSHIFEVVRTLTLTLTLPLPLPLTPSLTLTLTPTLTLYPTPNIFEVVRGGAPPHPAHPAPHLAAHLAAHLAPHPHGGSPVGYYSQPLSNGYSQPLSNGYPPELSEQGTEGWQTTRMPHMQVTLAPTPSLTLALTLTLTPTLHLTLTLTLTPTRCRRCTAISSARRRHTPRPAATQHRLAYYHPTATPPAVRHRSRRPACLRACRTRRTPARPRWPPHRP